MANVQFHASMSGYRVRDLFSPATSAIVFDGTSAATLTTLVDRISVTAVYFGTGLTPASGGAVSGLTFSAGASPWLSYGNALDGVTRFSYGGSLSVFQQAGADAAAVAMAGDDALTGSSKGDYLDAYAGNDTLDGGQGEDTMAGGTGDDLYFVDDTNDRVVEAAGAGRDIVIASVSFALAKGSEVERLEAAAGRKALALTGNEFANEILGNDGNNILDGGRGADTLTGGLGNDAYIIDNALDVIVETPGQGFDTALSSVSYVLSDASHVEAIAARGTASIALTGNSLSNKITGNTGHNVLKGLAGNDTIYGDGGNDRLYGGIGSDKLYGGMGSDKLYGEDGNDALYGDVGNDFLSGGAGKDRLFGGTGDDRLYGGDGNDVLYGDIGDDRLYGGAGNDLLYGGPGNNTLSGGDGRDTIYGSYNEDLISGGSGNDRLFGDSGNDTISGGLGNDLLSGGEGYDTFIFDTRPDSRTNVDRISDFNPWTDRISLKAKVFANIGYGALSSDAFWIGAKAHDASDRIIYDKPSGILYYDPDGTGAKAQVKFAIVEPGTDLTDAAFWLF
ncbi:calcium-binding protein [Microvirga flavescens]|uniref:calcium-binding protein n=1 Tax=Microvirga flavescens TaxID=2249811 RepID=UPI000DD91C6D|nr:calcium-binding protein [Microvirga flavescens]